MRTGVDISQIQRFGELLEDQKFLNRIFSLSEIDHIFSNKTEKGRQERLAGKFSAKEAVAKAMGYGISNGINYKDIQILPDNFGRPYVIFTGEAKRIFEEKFSFIDVSISHDGDYDIAFCIIS